MNEPELLDVEPSAEVSEEFDEAAAINEGGRHQLLERLEENTDTGPKLSAGDIDATWEDSVGEEAVGGGNPTPDQDIVEEIGQALGYTYEDNEPLRPEEKLEDRDRNRWELNPSSAEDN